MTGVSPPHFQDTLRDEIIRASGLRPASRRGTLLAMYDELGALYLVPIYCVRDPSNLGEKPAFEEFKDAAHAVKVYSDRLQMGWQQ